ncbi:hypothetical protein QUF74_14460 [Candidatus Halobeggiatoa sp. HSG11]|nr:hypothetical protein [Candidatus Halobeggiatoa sp. HSG11]
MKYLILLLLPLSISFDSTPQTKGAADLVIGCVKACSKIGLAARCSSDKSENNPNNDKKKR